MTELSDIAYPLTVSVVVAFGVAACIYQYIREQKQGKPDSTAFFFTARNSVSAFTIGWSFFAAAMGSWALFGPPSYCLYAGFLGTTMYAISSGIPILVLAYFGGIIHELMPNVLSMADFVRKRYGIVVSLFVGCLMLFNMAVALTAEYTAVGDLFQYVLGVDRVPIVIVIGAIAMAYTAMGGLYVSILTDQYQAIASVTVILVLVIYVSSTFKANLGPLPRSLQFDNYYGLAAVAVMPISLISSTLFSEAMWQRCWASENKKALYTGAVGGCIAVIVSVFLLGFGGILALWGNVWVPSGPDDTGNTILFSLLHDDWVIILVSVLAVTMSESAVDSLQNAVVDTLSCTLLKPFVDDMNIWIVRGLVILLNIPPIVVSLQGYNILQLFLLANLLTTTAFVPILAGVIPGPTARKVLTPFSVIFSCLLGLSSLFVWTETQRKVGQEYGNALWVTFFSAYDYPPFMLALGFSILGIFLGAGMEFAFRTILQVPYPELSDEEGNGFGNGYGTDNETGSMMNEKAKGNKDVLRDF